MSTPLQIQITATPGSTDPTPEEAAAAIAAVVSLLAQDASAQPPAAPLAHWGDAAKLVAQGLTPTRTPARPRWGTIERIHRAGKGGSGITGL